MSELINTAGRSNTKWRLLASVSAITLIAAFPLDAVADDGRPVIWIEVGAQLERLMDRQESYLPPFTTLLLENPFTPPGDVQTPPRYAFGEEGKLTFAPDGSDWVFSASIRYGRANSSGNAHQQLPTPSRKIIVHLPRYQEYFTNIAPVQAQRFATTVSQTHAANSRIDFQAGKDVGLGVFGQHGTSMFSAGVRFAQFTSRSQSRIDADPDLAIHYTQFSFGPYLSNYIKRGNPNWNLYSGKIIATHSFHGIGPSAAWDAAVTLIGNPDAGAITLDWGLNGAILFGRQKVVASHETMAHHASKHYSGALPTLYPTVIQVNARSKSVIVPNGGAFAGLSLRFSNAKVSVGYRADLFFNAMDGGIDTRRSENVGFYGPFATISVGIGG